MKFYSEVLNRNYDTVEELERAESLHEQRMAEKQAEAEAERKRQAQLRAERDSRWQEVREAYKKADKLKEKYVADYLRGQCELDGLFNFLMEV